MNYYDSISACKTERELFELWKKKNPVSIIYTENGHKKESMINHANVFISDGIVDETIWNDSHHKRIAYVLKEAYGETQDWSLTEWLLKVHPSSSFWRRIVEWSYGIQNTTPDKIAKYSPNIYHENKSLFQQIAVINLKKSSGKSSSNYNEIAAYAWEDRRELRKQLEIIKADIIVCGSTFSSLNLMYNNSICPEGAKCDNHFYNTDIISGNQTIIIDYYHPANRYPALVNYYAITNIYQQALLSKIA